MRDKGRKTPAWCPEVIFCSRWSPRHFSHLMPSIIEAISQNRVSDQMHQTHFPIRSHSPTVWWTFSGVITSRVSDAVEVIESVPLSLCLCVCQRCHGWTVRPTGPMFGTGMNLEYILDEIDGQGHRSKFKVTSFKKTRFFPYNCNALKDFILKN